MVANFKASVNASVNAEHHLYFNAFNLIPQIGPARFRKLLHFFESPKAAWQANPSQLAEAGLEEPVIAKVIEARRKIDPELEFSKLADYGLTLLTYLDDGYPKLLREIPNPPTVLYVKGELLPADDLGIAVVGTRKSTPYGRQAVEEIVRDLVRANLTVVSGLAHGIDALAHNFAVHYNGRTIAVLASGLDTIYPVSNRLIAEKILAGHGALISELPLGTVPLKHFFPYRNRIISGLSLGTVVIEAAADSGSLITARHALEQNRQVFAVPGSIFNPASVGPNHLLKLGAKPVTSAADILEDLNLETIQQQIIVEEIIGDNEEEQLILKILKREPTHVDAVVKTTGLSTATVAATLTIMEMKGKVRNLGANQYVKSK